jgi:GMP synthase PP-ATPase subunit
MVYCGRMSLKMFCINMKEWDLNVKGVDASARFLEALAGKSDPEKNARLSVGCLLRFLMMKHIELRM